MGGMPDPGRFPTLHARREGSGPPLLLLHGLGTSVREFRAVLPELARRYDVLALDLPGHGRSPAFPRGMRPDLGALTDAVQQELDDQGIGMPNVLGVSLGGRIALELARRQRTRSVVAISPTGPVTAPERLYQVGMLAASRLAYQGLAAGADGLMQSPVLRTAALSPLRARGWATPAGEAAGLIREFAAAEGFWRLLASAVLPEATVDYRAVQCPVRLVQGTHDVLALTQVLRLATLVPGAQLRLLPVAGHSPVTDTPARVIRLVDEAVAEGGRRAGERPGA
jgi:pimeloyl-ACP methyl ester carboxylesterase